eukprot:Gb_12972 [translate_table: standard]
MMQNGCLLLNVDAAFILKWHSRWRVSSPQALYLVWLAVAVAGHLGRSVDGTYTIGMFLTSTKVDTEADYPGIPTKDEGNDPNYFSLACLGTRQRFRCGGVSEDKGSVKEHVLIKNAKTKEGEVGQLAIIAFQKTEDINRHKVAVDEHVLYLFGTLEGSQFSLLWKAGRFVVSRQILGRKQLEISVPNLVPTTPLRDFLQDVAGLVETIVELDAELKELALRGKGHCEEGARSSRRVRKTIGISMRTYFVGDEEDTEEAVSVFRMQIAPNNTAVTVPIASSATTPARRGGASSLPSGSTKEENDLRGLYQVQYQKKAMRKRYMLSIGISVVKDRDLHMSILKVVIDVKVAKVQNQLGPCFWAAEPSLKRFSSEPLTVLLVAASTCDLAVAICFRTHSQNDNSLNSKSATLCANHMIMTHVLCFDYNLGNTILLDIQDAQIMTYA